MIAIASALVSSLFQILALPAPSENPRVIPSSRFVWCNDRLSCHSYSKNHRIINYMIHRNAPYTGPTVYSCLRPSGDRGLSGWFPMENTKTMGVSIAVEFRAVGVPVNSDVRVLICPLAVWDRGLSGAWKSVDSQKWIIIVWSPRPHTPVLIRRILRIWKPCSVTQYIPTNLILELQKLQKGD